MNLLFQLWLRINFKPNFTSQTANEITTTIEIIISIEVENAFKTKSSVAHFWKNDHHWNIFNYWNSNVFSTLKTKLLKSNPHIHLDRNLYKVYNARDDLLIWFIILKMRNTLKFGRNVIIILSIIFLPTKYFPHWFRLYFLICSFSFWSNIQ